MEKSDLNMFNISKRLYNEKLFNFNKHMEIEYIESYKGSKKRYAINLYFYNILDDIIQYPKTIYETKFEYDNYKDLIDMAFGFGLIDWAVERQMKQ